MIMRNDNDKLNKLRFTMTCIFRKVLRKTIITFLFVNGFMLV